MRAAQSRASFEQDVLSLVGTEPVLLSEVIATLRGGMRAPRDLASGRRWRGVREDTVEGILREHGAHLGSRLHGAGRAVYVATVPFTKASDWYGREYPVQSY
jgi:hypothetical protein